MGTGRTLYSCSPLSKVQGRHGTGNRALELSRDKNTYCPKGKHHTAHAVAVHKAGKQRTLSWGARRQERRKPGYGGQKFPELKRTAKTTKKALVKLKCRTCNYTIERLGIRLRKLEVGA